MTIGLDNEPPPALTTWAHATVGVECTSVRDVALQRVTDLDPRAALDAGAPADTWVGYSGDAR